MSTMRLGAKVVVHRGSDAQKKMGASRLVHGVVVGTRNHGRIIYVRLAEDDPLSTIPEWSRKGDVGHWGRSSVTRQT